MVVSGEERSLVFGHAPVASEPVQPALKADPDAASNSVGSPSASWGAPATPEAQPALAHQLQVATSSVLPGGAHYVAAPASDASHAASHVTMESLRRFGCDPNCDLCMGDPFGNFTHCTAPRFPPQ